MVIHLLTAMNDGTVVAPSYEFSDAVGWHLSMFLCQIDDNLTGIDIFAFAATPEDIGLTDAIVFAHLLDDVVEGEWPVVYFHGASEDTLGEFHVDVAVVDDGVALQ